MPDTSTERLVAALMGAGAPKALIEGARANRFHDFKSSSATPIVDLVTRLRLEGLDELAQRAMNGEFDATHEESEDWARSVEGQRIFRNLRGE